jgi:N-acetylneuraminic acid mutarotase
MKTKSEISGYILRRSAAALLFSCGVVALSSAINLPNDPPKVATPQNDTAFGVNGHENASSVPASAIRRNRMLTFADRVAFQRAIEEVYWRHRIWPKGRPDPKPPLEKVMSQVQIEKKVEDYLRNSQALGDYWQRPITPDQLQAEMERMANHTKQPAVLREIFAALGNDPFVIAECLARPVLAERLLSELYAHDQRFHGELKRRAQAELRTHPSVRQMRQTSGVYTEVEWIKSDFAESDSAPAEIKNVQPVRMNGSEWQESIEKLAGEFGNTKAADARGQIKPGVLSPLREDDGHYYAVAVMKKGKDRLKLATIAWLKEPLRSWLSRTETQVPVTMAAVGANYTLPVISSPSVGCTNDTWTPTSTTGVPTARVSHTAVWTGSEMIVWGGFFGVTILNSGGRYDPITDSWTATSTATAARGLHTAVWTGSEMIVWGGDGNNGLLNTGARYNPSTDSWTATSTTGAPSARRRHTAVWSGSEMIVWGGCTGVPAGCHNFLNTGGRYNPTTNSWTATGTTNAPAPRYLHTTVWTGSEMIVWGGSNNSINFNTGGRYNPSTDSWTPTSTTGAPDDRNQHTAVWAGSEMIVWGGVNTSGSLNTGGRYNPSTDSWTATSITNAPDGRQGHVAVWTGSEMVVWGGSNNSIDFNTGGRYNPSTDSWTATSTTDAPSARSFPTSVWTGSEMIVWGGIVLGDGELNTGGRYCAAAPITLSAAGRKVGGINTVRLTWSGATSANVDIYRNGVVIVTTANDGLYIDSTGDTGRAQYTYKVCEAGTMTCSNEVTVRFRQ